MRQRLFRGEAEEIFGLKARNPEPEGYDSADLDIINDVLGGNKERFRELVEKYEKMLYNLAYYKLGNAEDAADAVQECFIRIYKKLNTFRFQSSFSTWAYRICGNIALDMIRRNAGKSAFSLTREEKDGDITEADIADSRDEPSEVAARNETVEQVRAAIGALPEDHREIIVMRDINGLSYTHISELLEIEEGTVKSRLNRARNKLKEILKDKTELF